MPNGISDKTYSNEFLKKIKEDTESAATELIEIAKPEKGSVFVVGCSSSEVAGEKIGSFSSEEIGKIIFEAVYEITKKSGLYLAAQCCEHLNRAIICEKELAEKKNLEIVSVVPKLKAGGSFATATYNGLKKPVAVEYIKADLGIDIGDTLIGMHLKHVAVPVRTKIRKIGDANLVCARTRPKYIGGPRAKYE